MISRTPGRPSPSASPPSPRFHRALAGSWTEDNTGHALTATKVGPRRPTRPVTPISHDPATRQTGPPALSRTIYDLIPSWEATGHEQEAYAKQI